MKACPTSIDIPLFIREISTGNPLGAAETIFEQNILGGMCARVCPTEQLCEEACVREAAEGKPVKIGQLQRYATDAAMAEDGSSSRARRPTGKRVAVVGAGPAGLACAHRLAHARPRRGDLRRAPQGRRAQRIRHRHLQDAGRLRAGGGRLRAPRSAASTIETGQALGRDFTLDELRAGVRRGVPRHGLGGVNALRAEGEEMVPTGVDERRRFHRRRCARPRPRPTLPVGRRVVVIGGGMTAIDAAVQIQAAGRRGGDHLLPPRPGAHERLARSSRTSRPSKGVIIRHWLAPRRVLRDGRQGHRHRARIHRAARRQAGGHGRNHDHRRRPGVQGHRPDAGRAAGPRAWSWRAAASRSTPRAAPRATGSGPAATARRAATI